MAFVRLLRMPARPVQLVAAVYFALLAVFPSRADCQSTDISLASITQAAARAADRLTVQALRRVDAPPLMTKLPEQGGRAAARGGGPGAGGRGELVAYDFSSLEALLQSARKILEEPMQRPQLTGLRAFVNRYYPNIKELNPQHAKGIPVAFIEHGVAETAVTRARAVAESIRKMSSVAIDLSVRTVPEQQAVVTLQPEGGGAWHTGTSDTDFRNVYRGLYIYSVSKYGMKTISRPINLVDDSRPILECRLIPENQPDGPYPCNRK